MLNVSSRPRRSITSVTSLPPGPCMRATASSNSSVEISTPSTRLMTSPGSMPGARGRRTFDRRDDHEAVLALLDVDADAFDLLVALGLLLQPPVFFGVHEARVRIEHVGQAARGAVHEIGLRQILDVVALDVREHLREHAELLVRVEASRRERPREDQPTGEGGEHE